MTAGGLGNFSHMAANLEVAGEAVEKAYKGLYGWTGFGGSLCLVDPARKVTLMYTMSGQQSLQPPIDPRHLPILEAYQACMA